MIFIKTNWFIPKRFDAYNLGFITLMRPEVYHNEPLRDHERTHLRQMLRFPFNHMYLYHFNKGYRFKAEAEAFGKQATHFKGRQYTKAVKRFGLFLKDNYGLDKTHNQCIIAIQDEYVKQLKGKHKATEDNN